MTWAQDHRSSLSHERQSNLCANGQGLIILESASYFGLKFVPG